MKFSRLATKFKTFVVSEFIDDGFIFKNYDQMISYEKEQRICDTYKSNLENFKTNSEEPEIYMINEYFVSNETL